jgi:hypothetical protein
MLATTILVGSEKVHASVQSKPSLVVQPIFIL